MRREVKPVYEIAKPGTKTRGRRYPAGAWRRVLGLALLAGLALFVGYVAWASLSSRADLAYDMHNLIRLHVVANSDRPADQQVKLAVRDAILRASGDLFTARPPDEAVEVVKGNLPLFKRAAENVLRAYGYDYPVAVEFGTFSFPERTYGPLVLPAGDYQALRIVLGEGQGANWWCILFPPLCYLDVVGGLSANWGVTTGGVLAAGTGTAGTAAPATRVVSLDSLTASQARDLERILTRALDTVESQEGKRATDGKPAPVPRDGDLRIIVSDIPASRDSDLVVLVADTGSSRTEVRFYVFDRLRDLIRSLAQSAPWLVGSWEGGTVGPAPER